jgi:hypothetical protein
MLRLAALLLVGSLAPAAVLPAVAQSAAYSDGLVDRSAYEQWTASLGSAEHDGAMFWAAERSKPHPLPCTAHGDDPNSPWVAGCNAARLRLAPADARRKSEPEYRLGWNAYQQTAPIATTALPSSGQVLVTNKSYLDGFKNSEAWGQWRRSLAGEAWEGAQKGAMVPPASMCANKNPPADDPNLNRACHEIPCVIPGETRDPLWIAGCQEARRRVIQREERRATDPEYKRGWEAAYAAFREQYQRKIGQTAFVDCVKAEARWGGYSHDAESWTRLIKQCGKQAQTWLDNCKVQRGYNEESCDWDITLEAASAIK